MEGYSHWFPFKDCRKPADEICGPGREGRPLRGIWTLTGTNLTFDNPANRKLVG